MSDNRPLIAVMTCHRPGYRAKAQAQRDTWVPAVEQFADVRFFVGFDPDYTPGADEIVLEVNDSYYGLPAKVQAMASWAYYAGYKRMMKCDDDVFIIPERFKQIACGPAYEYSGRFRGACGGYPAAFPSGFAYWLGSKAMQVVAQAEHNGDWMDERWIGNLLANAGFFGYTDPHNYLVTGPFTPPEVIGQRTVLRDGTVFCQYGAPDMHRLWELYGHWQPLESKPKPLQAVRGERISHAQLMRAPLDKIPVEKTR